MASLDQKDDSIDIIEDVEAVKIGATIAPMVLAMVEPKLKP